MTKELAKSVAYSDLEKAYKAYTDLMIVYENACGGPYGARAHKEYFAIADSRNNIRAEVARRAEEASHGEQ